MLFQLPVGYLFISLLLLRNSIYRSIDWLADWLNYDKRFKFSEIVFNSFSPFICWMENRNHNKCNHRSTSISILVLDWNSRHILACHNDNMFHSFGRIGSDIRENMWRMDEFYWNLFADYFLWLWQLSLTKLHCISWLFLCFIFWHSDKYIWENFENPEIVLAESLDLDYVYQCHVFIQDVTLN